MLKEIKTQIQNNNLILFIGAGVPATLGLPTWKQLIARMADELGYDPDIFLKHGDYLTLAEYYVNQKGYIGELRDWMSREWSVGQNVLDASPIYSYITQMGCRLIYTTNYDHTLEEAFQTKGIPCKRIVDVGDLINLPMDCTQIVKFHGDVVKDSSIVLTEADYFDRLDFESPLDIKLRSDMLGKSILFLGYSLSDINIRLLIYKLDKLWKSANTAQHLRPRSYIFLTSPNPVQGAVFERRGISPIIGNALNSAKSLESFLKELCEA